MLEIFKQKEKALSKMEEAFTGKATSPELSKDKLADMLKTNPELLDAFERAYQENVLGADPQGLFDTNSRQAVDMSNKRPLPANAAEARKKVKPIIDRAVDELLADTSVYVYDGKTDHVEGPKVDAASIVPLTNDDLNELPFPFRPQLTGSLMSVDIKGPSFPHLLFFYERCRDQSLPEKERRYAYHMFRQGLDILDLDGVLYQMLDMNPNAMGNWLPKLVKACEGQEVFKIPATKVAKVPLPLLQLTRRDFEELNRTTMQIVDKWAVKAFELDESKDYFIKTGTYSSKFDFRNARVHEPKEVREIGEYLLYIHYQALQMAGFLSSPCIYGVSTTNEWVVREYIEDKESNPTIYKGLPLHTEFRVFVDCDKDTVIGQSPYWEPNTMKNRFGRWPDANNPNHKHDYVIYKAHEETLMDRYHKNLARVIEGIHGILPKLDLPGQWSIDVMLNGDDLWIIDMALAEQSAFYDCVPKELRRATPENWIPELRTETGAAENAN